MNDETILSSLHTNWLFRLSLSSNELFHSNFLHLLFGAMSSTPPANAGPNYLSVEALGMLLSALGISATIVEKCIAEARNRRLELHREYRTVGRESLDLAVIVFEKNQSGKKTSERVLVAVEVKVKSYPDDEQLRRYSTFIKESWHNSTTDYRPILILLTLVGGTGHQPPDDGSSILSTDFRTLACNLKGLTTPPVLAVVVDEYVKMCEWLGQLANIWNTKLSRLTILDIDEGFAKYEPFRLHAIWGKLCAAEVVRIAEEKLHKLGGSWISEGRRSTYSGYTNTWNAGIGLLAPTTTKDTPANTANENEVWMGVQIEGRSFRLVLSVRGCGLPIAGMDARQAVERALISLNTRHGLYAAINEGNWDSSIFSLEPSGLPSRAKPKNRERYQLPGYLNDSDFGFADYRLTLKPTANIADVAEEVVKVLNGGYNRPNGTATFSTILSEFERSPVKHDWMRSLTDGNP